MEKLTEKQYQELFDRENGGEKLSDKERIQMLVYEGYSEERANEIIYINSESYGKPDKNGIVTIV